MFQTLVNCNEDIRRLVEKGYSVAFDSNYLIVRDIPYLNADRQLQFGAIVSKLVFINKEQVTQDDHQIFFAGSAPYNLDGTPIPNLGGGPVQLTLSEASTDVVVERSFSNKPRSTGKYLDFFDKIDSYVAIISGPAIEMYHDVTPFTFRAVKDVVPETIFKFHDTLTSRAQITDLSGKFKDDVVAVIGLGGTGAYVLDFLVKTPVKEIRAFDADNYYIHNSFRSPGSVEEDEFGKPKAVVYYDRYENFRTGLSISRKRIDASCKDDLSGVTFAFVCVDQGAARAEIFDLLISQGIPFIDVGMGIDREKNLLNGFLRTTYYSKADSVEMRDKGYAPLADDPNNLYRTNIQISELNALNACLAVIKFKQSRGFYLEEDQTNNIVLQICDLKIYGHRENSED